MFDSRDGYPALIGDDAHASRARPMVFLPNVVLTRAGVVGKDVKNARRFQDHLVPALGVARDTARFYYNYN